MRSKPGPAAKLLPSAHAIEREYRVMAALAGRGVPVPQMLALCDDEAVIGRAFYVMSFAEGRVLWDQSLPGMAHARARRDLRRDEPRHRGAAQRRCRRLPAWPTTASRATTSSARSAAGASSTVASITQPIEAMDRLMDWLPAHMPASARDDRRSPWCTATIGSTTWSSTRPSRACWRCSTGSCPRSAIRWPTSATTAWPGTSRPAHSAASAGWTSPRWASRPRADYVRRYCERTGLATPEALAADWNFYLAYNLFRIAAILQGIAKRVEDGTAASAQARQAGAGARPLAELGWRFAQQA